MRGVVVMMTRRRDRYLLRIRDRALKFGMGGGGGDKRNQNRLEEWEKGGGRPMQSWR